MSTATASTLPAPIYIPIPPSRSTTPRPSRIDDDDVQRGRSDTVSSVSSSILQTPSTPPTLGIIQQGLVAEPESALAWNPPSKLQSLRQKLSRRSSRDEPRKGRLKGLLRINKSSTSIRSASTASSYSAAPTPLPGTPGVLVRDYGDYFSRPRASSLGIDAVERSQVRARAISLPVISLMVNHFDSMLPRELRVMILQTFISTWDGQGEWSGEAGARRELLRFSRVSREWQSLCLDGQLWPVVSLTPFAPYLHHATLRRILGPFTSGLNLRGMDNLQFVQSLPNLTTLDLRGCRRLRSDQICRLVAAPRLARVNLKGVAGVNGEVIRTLARNPFIEQLDVSRCWDISLADMVVYLKMIKWDTLKVLKVAGMKSYGRAASEFLQLVSDLRLETLDLLGCNFYDTDFEKLASHLEDRTLSLSHLILSGNTTLTLEVFPHLTKRLPFMTKLELAGMPELFIEDPDATGLIAMLKSMPQLERLDLEGTGIHGGVNDRVLDALPTGLAELHIGYAKNVTPEGMIRLIRGCPNLQILNADNTTATNAVMREFLRRRSGGRLDLIDCRAITPAAYGALAAATRPREGWIGAVHEAVPFAYGPSELTNLVLKTFWSWRRVGIPKTWREMRGDARQGSQEEISIPAIRRPSVARRGSWWRGDDEFDERAGCLIM